MTGSRDMIAIKLDALVSDVEAATSGLLARSEILQAVIREAHIADQAITDALLARWAAIEAGVR